MSEKPLVTIGIIHYNNKQFLDKCLASYLNQTYRNLEIIIIDDCSTDGSQEYLQALAAEHEQIRCIYHEQNSGGPSLAIQEIIEHANGKYFQWIASDDFVELDAIDKFVNFMESTDNDYVYCNFKIVNQHHAITNYWNYKTPSHNQIVQHIFNHCSGIIPMNGLYRTDFFRKHRLTWIIYQGNDYSSDTLNSLHFIRHGMRYGMLPEHLINYRIHEHNGSHNLSKRIKTSLSVYNFIIENFDESIYFPSIDWDNQTNREQMKNYQLALFFYERIREMLQLQRVPKYIKYTISQQELSQAVKPYIETGLMYVCKGLNTENPFSTQSTALKLQYENLLQ